MRRRVPTLLLILTLALIPATTACRDAVPDASVPDASVPDASVPDAAVPDAAVLLDADTSVLLDADRAFADAVAEGGADAWAAWFAPDGAMLQDGAGEIRGRAAVREAVAYLDRPGLSMRWTPERAGIAASGDLGWTTGEWTLRPAPEAAPTRGRYVSIWRRQPDGSWRVIMDLGVTVDPDRPSLNGDFDQGVAEDPR